MGEFHEEPGAAGTAQILMSAMPDARGSRDLVLFNTAAPLAFARKA